LLGGDGGDAFDVSLEHAFRKGFDADGGPHAVGDALQFLVARPLPRGFWCSRASAAGRGCA
jgi:hypothetical protein